MSQYIRYKLVGAGMKEQFNVKVASWKLVRVQ